jgi:hypothetical protein
MATAFPTPTCARQKLNYCVIAVWFLQVVGWLILSYQKKQYIYAPSTKVSRLESAPGCIPTKAQMVTARLTRVESTALT